MSEDTTQVTSTTVNRKARKERPSKGVERASYARPDRVGRPIGEARDIVGLLNANSDDWHYRWILSTANMDKRVYDALVVGWEFVDATKEHELIPGDYSIANHKDFGSFFRIPAARRAENEYLYLMKLPIDLWRQVEKYKADKIDAQERDIFRDRTLGEDEEHGQYNRAGDHVLEHDKWEEDQVTRPKQG